MKGYHGISWLLLVCLVGWSTGKRFDINNGFGDIEDFDVPELIEVNNADLAEMSSKGKPWKPKPEKPKPEKPEKPEFGYLSSFPDTFGLSSTWNLGSALGSPSGLFPSFTASRPTSSNDPGSPAVWNAGADTNFLVSPTQAGMSYSQNIGVPPPRPSPVLASPSNSLNVEYLSPQVIPPPVWSTNPQSPLQPQQNVQQQQLTASASQYPPVASVVTSPSSSSSWTVQQQTSPQQPQVLYEEPDPVSQPPPSGWSSQIPSASAPQAPVSWQQNSVTVQVPLSSWSQPSPSLMVSQSQPQWSAQPAPQKPQGWSLSPAQPQQVSFFQQSSSSPPPYSLYQQMNLHLLDPHIWEKIQNQNYEWYQLNYQRPLSHPPQQPSSQHQPQYQFQGTNIVVLPPEMPAFNVTGGVGSNNNAVNLTAVNNNGQHNNYNNSNSGGANINDSYITQFLDTIDAMADYIDPGFVPVQQYSNSDITVTVDEDKFFDKDDDLMGLDSDEDEMMMMIE